MSSPSPRLKLALQRFDSVNAQDPNRTASEGRDHPKELLYAARMTDWLHRLESEPSEVLQLAARCQHLARWSIPRDTFPMDRPGYHRWRATLYQFHADEAGRILREVGYDEATVGRVQALVRKENIKADPDMQLLEDVICLVFLENYFSDFARDRDGQKVVGILRKTWRKMSPRGHAAALALPLRPEDRALVEKALDG